MWFGQNDEQVATGERRGHRRLLAGKSHFNVVSKRLDWFVPFDVARTTEVGLATTVCLSCHGDATPICYWRRCWRCCPWWRWWRTSFVLFSISSAILFSISVFFFFSFFFLFFYIGKFSRDPKGAVGSSPCQYYSRTTDVGEAPPPPPPLRSTPSSRWPAPLYQPIKINLSFVSIQSTTLVKESRSESKSDILPHLIAKHRYWWFYSFPVISWKTLGGWNCLISANHFEIRPNKILLLIFYPITHK